MARDCAAIRRRLVSPSAAFSSRTLQEPCKTPDAADLLQQCGLSQLSFHIQAGQSLYTALQLASEESSASSRCFRNVQRWVAASTRYATTAVATKQVTWTVTLGHLDVVLQICEQEKIKGRAAYLAFLYDDLVRRQRARRADPLLDILQSPRKWTKTYWSWRGSAGLSDAQASKTLLTSADCSSAETAAVAAAEQSSKAS